MMSTCQRDNVSYSWWKLSIISWSVSVCDTLMSPKTTNFKMVISKLRSRYKLQKVWNCVWPCCYSKGFCTSSELKLKPLSSPSHNIALGNQTNFLICNSFVFKVLLVQALKYLELCKVRSNVECWATDIQDAPNPKFTGYNIYMKFIHWQYLCSVSGCQH